MGLESMQRQTSPQHVLARSNVAREPMLLDRACARKAIRSVMSPPIGRSAVAFTPQQAASPSLHSILSASPQLGSPLSPIAGGQPDEEGDKVSTAGTTFMLVNGIVGAGCLGLPYMVARCGLLLSALVGVVVVTVVLFASLCLIRSIDVIQARRFDSHRLTGTPLDNSEMDFATLGEATYGPRGRRFINIVFIIELFMANVSFYVLIGVNASLLAGFLGLSIESWVSIIISASVSFLLFYVPVRGLAFLSMISLAFMSLLLFVLFSAGADMPIIAAADTHTELVWWRPVGFCPAVGSVLFCFGGAPLIPSIYFSAKEPAKFSSCISVSFIGAALYYATAGAGGYLLYGPGVSKSFTENLGKALGHTILPGAAAKVLPFLAALGMLVKLQSVMPLLGSAILAACGRTSNLDRAFLLALTSVVAISCRSILDVAMSVTGLVATMTVSVIFPLLVYLRLNEVNRATRCMVWIIIVMSGTFAICGTVQQVRDIINGSAGT